MEKEIDDCKDMDGWAEQCQVLLVGVVISSGCGNHNSQFSGYFEG